jgi:hypothetical protein
MAVLSRARFRGVILIGSLLAPVAQGQNAEEYQIKAAFLYNFAKFVEWPSQTFQSTAAPIVICVLGQNPFGHALEEAVAGKVVAGRGLITREVADVKQSSSCQILFIGVSERKRWRDILAGIKTGCVLTVGESAEFTASGGIISLILEDGKVRFQINVDAAAQEKIHISSKLLSLAQVVRN